MNTEQKIVENDEDIVRQPEKHARGWAILNRVNSTRHNLYQQKQRIRLF